MSESAIAAGSHPVSDWVDLDDLQADPFPAFERLRREAPVSWVPALNRYLVTSFADCHTVEQDQETFSANEEGSLMKRAMGHSMLRKDDPEHADERSAWQPPLRPRAIKEQWQQVFEKNAETSLAELIESGPGTDLIAGFAAPYAAENLRVILGFENATQQDLQRWSQTMINGTGNYADDAQVWADSLASFDEVDAALDELIPYYRAHPNGSMISGLVNSAGYQMPVESIRANMKMTIGGGLNEPRDVLGVAAWALLERRDQLDQVLADPSLWMAAFDEAIRWIAPIGMYPRQTTREVELGGVLLPAGAKLGVCTLSAGRDDAQYDDAATFDINREKKPHLSFGGGAHYCAGAWVAKAAVAGIGLPLLFDRLKGLRLSDDRPARIGGWVFRGLLDLPVDWDATA